MLNKPYNLFDVNSSISDEWSSDSKTVLKGTGWAEDPGIIVAETVKMEEEEEEQGSEKSDPGVITPKPLEEDYELKQGSEQPDPDIE